MIYQVDKAIKYTTKHGICVVEINEQKNTQLPVYFPDHRILKKKVAKRLGGGEGEGGGGWPEVS